ncbi:MAG: CPBP family intramembrane glutamic endopeptidase [Longimicrobiaceae bacterium]
MSTALDLVFVALIAAAWPLYELLVDWPGFLRRVREKPHAARVREYAGSIAVQWALAAGGVAIWLRAGRSWDALGVRMPEGVRLWAGATLVLLLGALYARQIAALGRSPETRARLRGHLARAGLGDLLPHNGVEVRWMLALAVTAGVCEELLFRGLFVGMLAPWLGWWGVAALGVPVFGLLHAYQGASGIVRTAVVGAALTLVVAATRSLLPAMALHALIDVGAGLATWTVLREAEEPRQASPRLRATA